MMAIPDSVGIGYKKKYSKENPRRLAGTVQTDARGKFTMVYILGWVRIDLIEREK